MSKTPAYISSSDHQSQLQDDLATIPEEDEELDLVDQDTLVFDSKESEDKQFDTAVDTTSDDSAITMAKPVTAAFISVQIPREQVGCLQVTSPTPRVFREIPT